MKKVQISAFLLAMTVLHTSAFADVYRCAEADGRCHWYVVNEGDLGPAGDESLCGTEVYKKAPDQSCHEYSPCGADEGKATEASCK